MLVIVGLGNPDSKYRNTRHNIGFQCLDVLSESWGIKLGERRAKAVLGTGYRQGQQVVLAKPRTYMNNSGEGVAYLLTRFAAKPEDLLIIYDERALPVGRLRLRPEGSDAGHNGVKSIISTIQSQGFPRLRVGIGHPQGGQDSIRHVLGRFSDEESKIISQSINTVVAAIECLLDNGIDEAMNRFNRAPEEESTQSSGSAVDNNEN